MLLLIITCFSYFYLPSLDPLFSISSDLAIDKKNSSSSSSSLVPGSSVSSNSSDFTQGLDESSNQLLKHSSDKGTATGTGVGTGTNTGTGTGFKGQSEGLDQDINTTDCKYILSSITSPLLR